MGTDTAGSLSLSGCTLRSVSEGQALGRGLRSASNPEGARFPRAPPLPKRSEPRTQLRGGSSQTR